MHVVLHNHNHSTKTCICSWAFSWVAWHVHGRTYSHIKGKPCHMDFFSWGEQGTELGTTQTGQDKVGEKGPTPPRAEVQGFPQLGRLALSVPLDFACVSNMLGHRSGVAQSRIWLSSNQILIGHERTLAWAESRFGFIFNHIRIENERKLACSAHSNT